MISAGAAVVVPCFAWRCSHDRAISTLVPVVLMHGLISQFAQDLHAVVRHFVFIAQEPLGMFVLHSVGNAMASALRLTLLTVAVLALSQVATANRQGTLQRSLCPVRVFVPYSGAPYWSLLSFHGRQTIVFIANAVWFALSCSSQHDRGAHTESCVSHCQHIDDRHQQQCKRHGRCELYVHECVSGDECNHQHDHSQQHDRPRGTNHQQHFAACSLWYLICTPSCACTVRLTLYRRVVECRTARVPAVR